MDLSRKRMIQLLVVVFSICCIYYAYDKPKRTKEQKYEIAIDPADFRGEDLEKSIREYYDIQVEYGKIDSCYIMIKKEKLGYILEVNRNVSKGNVKSSVNNAGRLISRDMEWIRLTFPEVYSVQYSIFSGDKLELRTKVYGDFLKVYRHNFKFAEENDFSNLGFNEFVIDDLATAALKGNETMSLQGLEMTEEENKEYESLLDEYYYITAEKTLLYYMTALRNEDKDREFELLYNGDENFNMTLEVFKSGIISENENLIKEFIDACLHQKMAKLNYSDQGEEVYVNIGDIFSINMKTDEDGFWRVVYGSIKKL